MHYNQKQVEIMLDQYNLEYLENHPDPWIRYRTFLDLCGLPGCDPRVAGAHGEILRHPLIMKTLSEVAAWPGVVLSSHKSAGQLYHKMAFLAEIGLTVQDGSLADVLGKMTAQIDEYGFPRLSAAIPAQYGGDGQEKLAWALCDSPLLLWTMLKMGALELAEARRGVDELTSLVRQNGWPCAVCKELGHFRGPGRKDDPCPYSTLLMLKLLLDLPPSFPDDGRRIESAIAAGVASLLDLWQHSREQHPYQFYMGTDFRKLKAPLIWYDLLHVLDVLSRSEIACLDSRFSDMLQVMNDKAGPCGLFTPESEWKAWNGWEFGQKKQPSAWLTFLVYRINFRAGRLRAA
jgi:hypothetical protein